MQSSRHVRLTTRLSTHGVLLTILGLILATQLMAAPYSLDSLGREHVKATMAEVELAPSYHEQLVLLGRAYEEAHEDGRFPVALALVARGRHLAKAQANRAEAFEAYYEFLDGLDHDLFPIEKQSHYLYRLASFRAFDGHINHAEAEFYKLLERDEHELNPVTRYSIHYMLAYCSYYVGELERAVKHSRKSAYGFLRIGQRERALEGFDGMSTTFYKLDKIDSALHYGRRGIALISDESSRTTYNLYLNYSEALMANNQLDSAFFYAHRARKLVSEKAPSSRARVNLCIANLNRRAKRYLKAVEFYELAIDDFSSANEVYHLAEALDSLRAVHVYRGDYPAAYDAAMRAFSKSDSLRDDRIEKDNARIAAEHERDVLAKELAASKGERELAKAILQKQKSERAAIAGLVALLLMAIGFVVYRIRIRRKLTDHLQAEVAARTAELEEHGARLEEQAIQLKQSNEELERFAYIASHDLKTPIRNINSFLGLIQRRLPVEARAIVAEYLEIAMTNARQMNDLVTDVLEFSRLNANLEEISTEASVAHVVRGVEMTMRRELQKRNAKITCDGDAKVMLPKGALEQILSNLIGNGLKYNEAESPLVKVVATDMGNQVRLTVTDNGIGIAPEFHEKVFEVFRRLHTSDRYSGTGVGLASCKKVIDRVGGRIHIDSEVGMGSTFTVDLPKSLTEQSESADVASAQTAQA